MHHEARVMRTITQTISSFFNNHNENLGHNIGAFQASECAKMVLPQPTGNRSVREVLELSLIENAISLTSQGWTATIPHTSRYGLEYLSGSAFILLLLFFHDTMLVGKMILETHIIDLENSSNHCRLSVNNYKPKYSTIILAIRTK